MLCVQELILAMIGVLLMVIFVDSDMVSTSAFFKYNIVSSGITQDSNQWFILRLCLHLNVAYGYHFQKDGLWAFQMIFRMSLFKFNKTLC